jgi:Flp pilus assembly protein TadD
MAETIVCAACGAKIKGGRARCLRCGEVLNPAVAQVPVRGWREFVSGHRAPVTIGGALALLAMLLLVASRVQEPAAVSGTPAPGAGSPLPVVRNSPTPGTTAPEASLLEPHTDIDVQRLGNAAYTRGDFAGALESLQKAVELNPHNPTALNNLGQVLVRLGRAKDALAYFERAAALSPSDWTPRFNLAHAYGEMGDWTHAIPEYEHAVQLFPDDYVTHYNLALAFHKAGREEPAVAEYRRAIALAPSEPSFRLSLAISYERLQRPTDAAAAYEEYLDLAPNAADASKVKARIETLRKPVQG